MNISSKFIYALTRAAFERELSNIPEGLDPIVFIEDTKEVWVHNNYFSLGYPKIEVNESSGIITVQIGDDKFTLQTAGSSLAIRKGTGNSIIISSSALSSINTEAPLEWIDDGRNSRLVHKISGAEPGQYGQSGNTDTANIIHIPRVTVDKYGHITELISARVSIRDYVDQVAPSNLPGERNILLSYNEKNPLAETAQVRKASGLTFNDALKLLKVEGGIDVNDDITINEGDLKVVKGLIIGNLQGNVSGEATPKLHLSDKAEYGGASLNLYGHVKLQDELTEEPLPSSNNSEIGNATVARGIAASPKMVWDTHQKIMVDLNKKPNLGGFIVNGDQVTITEPKQMVEIIGINGVTVTVTNKGFSISGREFSGYDESNNKKELDNIKFSKDFSFTSENEMHIRWDEIH